MCQSDRIPELKGAYIYGDYDTGKLWSLKLAGTDPGGGSVTNISNSRTRRFALWNLLRTELAVYVVDFAGGGLHRIVKAEHEVATKHFPKKLSETGLFASTKDHVPATGLIPYSVNAPRSDGAEKDRFIALPGNSKIEMDSVVILMTGSTRTQAGGSPTERCWSRRFRSKWRRATLPVSADWKLVFCSTAGCLEMTTNTDAGLAGLHLRLE